MDLLKNATPAEKRAAAELQRIVAKYDIRWAHDPDRPYPVEEMGWMPVGWVPMVERLVARLIKLGWNRRLAQVKEKFGGLRFYVDDASDEVHAAIDRAERHSYRTCEVCGARGRLMGDGALGTRCVAHELKKRGG